MRLIVPNRCLAARRVRFSGPVILLRWREIQITGPLKRTLHKLAILLCALGISTIARAASTTAPSGEYEVQEWVILLVDANQTSANAPGTFRSTLPDFVSSRRDSALPDNRRDFMPMGLIRVLGGAPETKFDVLLEIKGGAFDAHWPKAETKSNRLLWRNVTPSPAPVNTYNIDEKHWFAQLRAGESSYVMTTGPGDRFLLYDAEIPYRLPLKVEGGDKGKYKISNAGDLPLHDLEFYKPGEGGAWQSAYVGDLAAGPGRAATRPTTGAAAASRPTTQEVFASTQRDKPATKPVAHATTKPSTAPAGKDLVLAETQSKEIPVADWKQRLTAVGLAATDLDTITKILAKVAPDKKRLTAIYRLDPADLDKLIPEEIVPMPRKTTRVGLIIARNIDPGIVKEVEDLIAQLGDPDWNKREAAQKQLAELGRAAEPQLKSAAGKTKDIEIVFRTEKLLRSLNNPGPGRRR